MSSHANISSPEKPKISNYRDLLVWARSMDLVEICYKLSKQFPQSEIYGLTSQLRRASVSVPANIAEGHGRRNLGEYLQHLSIANGSLKEVETHILIAGRLKYLQDEEIVPAMAVSTEVGKMLSSLIQKLRERRL
jgi:four helix bundle protein